MKNLQVVLWRELSEKFREALIALPALIVCLILDFFAGAFLGRFFEKIMLSYPVIFVILPGLMGLRGNIFGAMASRFTTMLHLGEMEPKLRDKNVVKNIFLGILLSVLPVVVLWIVGVIKVGNVASGVIVLLIVLTSTIFVSLIMGYATAIATVLPFKRGIDPDTVAAPLVTSAGDLVTIPFLVLFILLHEDLPRLFDILVLLAVFLLLVMGFRTKFESEEKRMVGEILGIIGVLALFSSISGGLLESYSEVIYASVVFSVMYPAILDTAGNYGSIIGAKTSTKLHLGEIESVLNRDSLLDIFVYFVTSFFIAILMNVVAIGVVKVSLGKNVGLVFPFIILYPFLVLFNMFIGYFFAIIFDRLGLDPDNATVPTITTLADIFSTLFTVGVAYLIV
ncbi:magnesium transporter MgtE [Thermococcus sp. 101 C5]|uniref:magnesium transporter n=1 Tax=Thermococcus sp. 101 C5 TaxID=2654197 RepID=UPI00128D01F2|nr:magnesium transporter [Thermococcus sp. 101 C5]MPW38277.1 magnesium transporter MgtE [Thermococcus sp. 101 C5]